MKYLESNLVCVNEVSLPVGKKNDIAYEISERVWWIYKMKIVAAAWKWRDESECP